MPKVILYDEFDSVIGEKEFEEGKLLSSALMETWPEGFPGFTVLAVGPDGNLLSENKVPETYMKNGEIYSVALRPQFDPITLTILSMTFTISVSTVISAVTLLATFLMRPEMPKVGEQYQWDDSDRPQFFSGQSNKFSPGSRVPEVFGQMRIWPNLIAEPYTFYEGDSQILEELYIVSNGHCEVFNPRLYDEEIEDLPEGSITVYQPGDEWPQDFKIVRSNAFVGAVELPAANETITSGVDVVINTSGSIFVNLDGYFSDFSALAGSWMFFEYEGIADDPGNLQWYEITSIAADGKTMNISPSPGTQKTVTDGTTSFSIANDIEMDSGEPKVFAAGGWGYTNGWYFTRNQHTGISVPGTVGLHSTSFAQGSITWGNKTFSGGGHDEAPPTITISNRFWTKAASSRFASFTFASLSQSGTKPDVPGSGYSSAIFNIPGDNTTECHFDIEFPSGLYQQEGGGTPVSRQVLVEFNFRLVGEEDWIQLAFAYTDLTRVSRRFTQEVDWTTIADDYEDPTEDGDYPNPGNQPNGQYECFFRRITEWVPDSSNVVTLDACRLIGLRGRQVVTGTDLDGDILQYTMVRLRLSTQNLAQVQQGRSFNVLAQRYLPDWADGDGTALVETRKIKDAILYTLLGGIGEPTAWTKSDVDVAALNTIQDDIESISMAAGQFNGIVDQTLTAEDQMALIAANSRIIIFRRASNVYFNRPKAGTIPRTLINARNKVTPERKTMNFSMQNEPDSIIIRYLDQDDDYKEKTVEYKETTGTPLNPSEQSVIGITRGAEAQRLAQFLWDKRKYERDTVEVDMGPEGMFLGPGDVVAMTDHLTVERPIEGEIVEDLGGNVYRLDQPVPDGDYVLTLRDSFGELYDRSVRPVTDGGGLDGLMQINQWAGVTMPSGVNSQVGLLYSFTPITDADAELYQVVELTPSREGPAKIIVLRYDDRTYQSDLLDIQAVAAKKRGPRFGN